MQFSFNFVVYAASNKQYREAYRMFLREAVFRLDRGDNDWTNEKGCNSSTSFTLNQGREGQQKNDCSPTPFEFPFLSNWFNQSPKLWTKS
jgi:hypothetical protein